MVVWGARALVCSVLAMAFVVAGVGAGEIRRPLPTRVGSENTISLVPAERTAAEALASGIAALEASDLDAAEAALEVARAAGPIRDFVDLYRARLLLARGSYAAAATLADDARSTYPDSPTQVDLARLAGEARAALGHEAQAQVSWTAALEHTDDARVRREIKLAIIASRQRQGELEAGTDPERLLASEFPGSFVAGELLVGRRSAEMALLAAADLGAEGRGAAAVEAYHEAIRAGLVGEDLRRARLGQGIALFRLRRYAEALPTFELLGNDAEGRFWRARTLARLGRVERAIVGFEALAGSPDADIAMRSAYLAGTLLEDRGQHVRAMAHYARVAENQEDSGRALDALWRIGWSAWMRGDFQEARRRFAEMVARTENEADALRARYWEARAAERSGESEAARTGLEAIARGWPISYYGWRAQQRLGQIDAAAMPLQPEQATGRPTLPQGEFVRVALLLAADLREAARAELEPIAARARTRPDHERVGRLFVEAGDYYGAQRLIVDAYSVSLARGVRAGDETLMWLSWPPAFRELVEHSLPSSGRIEPALVWAIMREESSFRPEVMSSAGAIGLLQLMPETARRQAKRSGMIPIADDEELFAPATNIRLGSAYLDYLAERFPDRLSATIGSYNAGPNAVARWLRGEAGGWEDDVWVEDIPYGQTRSYVKRVLRSVHVYRSFY